MGTSPVSPLDRAFFDRSPLAVAPELLGRILRGTSADGVVEVRLTEVEAYDGPNDPGSHAYRGKTTRNATMFGPPGHVYVYFTYGMHFCMNLVCGPAGRARAVLLRAGEVVSGEDLARARRPAARSSRELARGPARMARALGVERSYDGTDACAAGSPLVVRAGEPVDPDRVRRGPRVGLSAAADRAWRFWAEGEPTVSTYRPHTPRRSRTR